MRISIEKLERAGYKTHMDVKGGFLDISPVSPLEIDWDMMRDQWRDCGLSPYAVDAGLDAFHIEVEMHQIMQACKGE